MYVSAQPCVCLQEVLSKCLKTEPSICKASKCFHDSWKFILSLESSKNPRSKSGNNSLTYRGG